MKFYTIYSPSSGQVLAIIGGDYKDQEEIYVSPEHGILAGIAKEDEHYIELVIFPGFTGHTPLILDRPAMVPQVTGSTISGLPQPCTAIIEGQNHEIPDGELELELVYPGRYEVHLESFPYKPATVVIDHEN